jgi:hypothetical protein
MKKMTTILIAGTAIAAASYAQTTTVSSANIVGYAQTIHPSGRVIAAMQFINATNTPETVYGDSLPLNSKIYVWSGTGYSIATYGPVFVPGQGLVTKWNSSPLLEMGKAYWVETPSEVEVIQSGDVPLEDSVEIAIQEGLQLLTYPYPVERTILQLGFNPSVGDKLYVWDADTGYVIVTYGPVFVPGQGLVTKWNSDLTVQVGEGFWYSAVSNSNWVVEKPF